LDFGPTEIPVDRIVRPRAQPDLVEHLAGGVLGAHHGAFAAAAEKSAFASGRGAGRRFR
jgi:hypothetical protein